MIKKTLKSFYINFRVPRLQNKIIVFQSDDWGSLRTSNKSALDVLRKNNVKVDECHYTLYDSIASSDDLELLFELLSNYKDLNNSNPVITANSLVANPNFLKIRESNYREYYYEGLVDTLSRYSNQIALFDLWKEGISKNVFLPQSHGREHLNISRWMRSLAFDDKITKLAFDLEIFALSNKILPEKRSSHLAAFDIDEYGDNYDRKKIVKEGLDLFQRTFGYQSQSFIAPNYVWDDDIEKTLFDSGVKYIQSSRIQQKPMISNGKQKISHYTGQKNRLGQMYMVRNAHFEPSEDQNRDWADSVMKEIELSFIFNKPVIISTHRVNYVGRLNEKNRDQSLTQLNRLLKMILKKWPDVRFMDTTGLFDLLNHKLK